MTRIILSPTTPIQTLGSIQPHSQFITGSSSRGKRATYLYLVPNVRICGSTPPCPITLHGMVLNYFSPSIKLVEIKAVTSWASTLLRKQILRKIFCPQKQIVSKHLTLITQFTIHFNTIIINFVICMPLTFLQYL